MTALVHEGILKFRITTNISCLFQGILCSIAVFCLTGADVKIPFQRRTAQQGRTIKIRCEVTGEDFLRWETPSREASLGVPQLQAENITAESTGRVRLERSENYYFLRIEDVRVSDGGNYTCIGSKQSSSFTLEVDCK